VAQKEGLLPIRKNGFFGLRNPVANDVNLSRIRNLI
jgi:hypothetical protein